MKVILKTNLVIWCWWYAHIHFIKESYIHWLIISKSLKYPIVQLIICRVSFVIFQITEIKVCWRYGKCLSWYGEFRHNSTNKMVACLLVLYIYLFDTPNSPIFLHKNRWHSGWNCTAICNIYYCIFIFGMSANIFCQDSKGRKLIFVLFHNLTKDINEPIILLASLKMFYNHRKEC